MNITELESFNLDDAIQFNAELNPALWKNHKLKPEVREQLLKIADDFREFLGVSDLAVSDITISGSNASYSYTSKSDIDLHLVADIPKLDHEELYKELFSAKKYQYNNQHNITIKGHAVELYVQNPVEKHHSQGIYSVLNDDWVSIPKKRKADIDDLSVRAKYDTLVPQIEQAVESNDAVTISTLTDKIRDLRRAGLEQGGEFSPENLVFKMLRNQGFIDKLYRAKSSAVDDTLSLEHITSDKDKSPGSYGWVGDAVAEDNEWSASQVAADFRQWVKNKFPGVEADVYGATHGGIVVSKIQVPPGERKTGLATAVMKELTRISDEHQIVVSLTPSNEFGASKARLIDFYKRFGFVMNKGKSKDFTVSELMYREPKGYVSEGVGRITPMNQTKDVGPNEIAVQAKKFGNTVDIDGYPKHKMTDDYSSLAVRLKESFDSFVPVLDEANMSPGVLSKWAEQNANNIVMGFEAELIFSEVEPSGKAEDESVLGIQDFMTWYKNNGGELFSRDYQSIVNDFENFKEEYIEDLIADFEPDDDEYRDERRHELAEYNYGKRYFELDDDEDEALEAEIEEEINKNQLPYRTWYDEQVDAFKDSIEVNDEDLERDWLNNRGLYYMSDVLAYFDIDWPTIPAEDGFSDDAAEDIAAAIERRMGVDVIVSSEYHGTEKNNTSWYIEPDSSIEPDNSSDMGAEIVSPPMPYPTAISKMREFFSIVGPNVYTNSSTGFHMSMSIPGKMSNVDYVKLILFLGDRYVLSEFDRVRNSYAKAITQAVDDERAKGNYIVTKKLMSQDDATYIFEKLKQGMARWAATALVAPDSTDRYNVVSVRNGYMELRAAGGSNYEANIDLLINTANRYAFAMTVASDPNLYKEEYYKKLYKMLAYNVQPAYTDAISLFAEYATGKADLTALKQKYKMFRPGKIKPTDTARKKDTFVNSLLANLRAGQIVPNASTEAKNGLVQLLLNISKNNNEIGDIVHDFLYYARSMYVDTTGDGTRNDVISSGQYQTLSANVQELLKRIYQQ